MISVNSGHPGACLFEATAAKDCDAIVKLYATNARNSLASYLSMKSRWAQQEAYSKAGMSLLLHLFQRCMPKKTKRNRIEFP
jgi:hypothetical protein